MPNEKLWTMGGAAFMAGQYLLTATPTKLVSPKDFLTDTDLESERLIRRELVRNFPEIPFFGEESDGKVIAVGEQWVVDPVDGTVNFFHRDDHWGVSIGLVRDGIPVAGVVYLPAKCQMFSTKVGRPTYMFPIENGHIGAPTPVSVSTDDETRKPLVLIEWVKERNEGRDHRRVVEMLSRLDEKFLYPQIRNASTGSLMMVAKGVASGFVHLRPDPFDIAAACLMVENAGGRVTNLAGQPWNVLSAEKGIVASNGIIHEQILEIVNS